MMNWLRENAAGVVLRTSPYDFTRKKRGPYKAFTLIELLVVIAIIGLLSSVVLASISSARESARKSAILSELNSVNTQAALFYNQNGSYSGLCEDDQINQMVLSLESTAESVACWVASNTYAADDYRSKLAISEYGISVTSDDNYFIGDPGGAATFLEVDNPFRQANFTTAQQACREVDGRLPSVSALRALFLLENMTPEGFAQFEHWTNSSSSDNPLAAYIVSLGNGFVGLYDKPANVRFRCVQ